MSNATRDRSERIKRQRAQLLAGEPLCRICKAAGRTSRAVEVDHIRPISKGGTDDPGNLQPLCLSCHREKTAQERGAWPKVDASGWPAPAPQQQPNRAEGDTSGNPLDKPGRLSMA